MKLVENPVTFSFKARIMPLNVAATSVKLAIPPPITRALLRPSGSAVAHYRETVGLFMLLRENKLT